MIPVALVSPGQRASGRARAPAVAGAGDELGNVGEQSSTFAEERQRRPNRRAVQFALL